MSASSPARAGAPPSEGRGGAGAPLNPLRVLVIASSYPRWPGDLAGVFVAEQAGALAERGHQVTVLAPFAPDLPTSEGAQPQVGASGVTVVRPRGSGGPFYGAGIADNLRVSPGRIARLPSALAVLGAAAVRLARRADVVLSHWLLPGAVIGGVAARVARVGHVCIAHSGGVHLLAAVPSLIGRPVARAIVTGADHVVCSSAHLRDKLLRLVPTAGAQTSVSPTGVHAARYRRSEPLAAPGGSDVLDLLFVGRLVPVKGLDVAIEALAGLGGEGGVRLTVVGDGPLREDLEEQARDCRAPVRFVGARPTDAIPEILVRYHGLLLPSRVLCNGRTEGTPRVLLEALASGLPVATADVGGTRAALGHGGGEVFPSDDPAALRGLVERWRRDPSRLAQLSADAEAAAAAFDWARLVPSVEDRLREAAGRPRGSSRRRM